MEERLRDALSQAEACCADTDAAPDLVSLAAESEMASGPDTRGGGRTDLPPLEALQRACELLTQGQGNMDLWPLLQSKQDQLEQQLESAGMPVGEPPPVLGVGSRKARSGTGGSFEGESAAVAALREFCEKHLLVRPGMEVGNCSASGAELRLRKRRCFDVQIRLRLGLAALRVQRGGGGDPLPNKEYMVLKKFVQACCFERGGRC